jgi:hypothetical protein
MIPVNFFPNITQRTVGVHEYVAQFSQATRPASGRRELGWPTTYR